VLVQAGAFPILLRGQYARLYSWVSATSGFFGFLGRAGDIMDAVRRAEGSKAVPSKLFSKGDTRGLRS